MVSLAQSLHRRCIRIMELEGGRLCTYKGHNFRKQSDNYFWTQSPCMRWRVSGLRHKLPRFLGLSAPMSLSCGHILPFPQAPNACELNGAVKTLLKSGHLNYLTD